MSKCNLNAERAARTCGYIFGAQTLLAAVTALVGDLTCNDQEKAEILAHCGAVDSLLTDASGAVPICGDCGAEVEGVQPFTFPEKAGAPPAAI